MNLSTLVDATIRDVRYAFRALARTPGFALTAVLTLALGIGANATVFSAVNAVLLRPLPFPDADRLVELRQRLDGRAETRVAPVRLEDWNRLNVAFDAITGFYVEDVSDTSGDMPERVRRAFVAPRFTEVWQVPPALGRGFTSANHLVGGPSSVLISDRYWRRRFDADPHAVGRSVRTGTASHVVIGVMPATFLFPDRDVDWWFPIATDSKYAQARTATWYTTVGRLAPGVSLEQAQDNIVSVQRQLAQQYPESDGKIGVSLIALKETAIGDVRGSLWFLFGAVSVLLLITCTNIAALLLSRATHRRHETALRLSLGASPVVVVRQLLVESLTLSLAGALLGLAASTAALALIRDSLVGFPRVDEISLDWRIVAYTLASAFLVAILCGILPALSGARHSPASTLNAGSRTQLSAGHSLQWLLVGTQVALSVLLLAGAGLLVRNVYELGRVEAGFDTSRVLTFRISGDYAETVAYDRLILRLERARDALSSLPGVERVATSMTLPGVPAQFETAFALVEARDEAEQRMPAESRFVSPEYFAAMRIPLLEGEPCRQQAFRTTQDLLVNRAFVRRYLSARSSAQDLHLSTAGPAPPGRIVGVVGDARETGFDREPSPTVYTCFNAPGPTPFFLVRTAGDPVALTQAVRLRIKEIEPLRAVYDIAPLEERIDDAFAQNRWRMALLAFFAAAALALACVGLYGTLSYVVSLRRREIGLRLAIGALRGGIITSFIAHTLRVVAFAIVAGVLLVLVMARTMGSVFPEVAAVDPVVLSAVVGIVLVVAALAALIPSTRAALVEPMEVLREG